MHGGFPFPSPQGQVPEQVVSKVGKDILVVVVIDLEAPLHDCKDGGA